MARKSNSPNDKPRPQSRRKATLNSRNAPRKSATAPFDPARFPDLKEMHSDEIGVGYVIGVARSPKSGTQLGGPKGLKCCFGTLGGAPADHVGLWHIASFRCSAIIRQVWEAKRTSDEPSARTYL